jgi:hypothetical protein
MKAENRQIKFVLWKESGQDTPVATIGFVQDETDSHLALSIFSEVPNWRTSSGQSRIPKDLIIFEQVVTPKHLSRP